MAKHSLSPEEHLRQQLQQQFARVKASYSFKKLRLYCDLIKALDLDLNYFLSLGYFSQDWEKSVSYIELALLFSKIENKEIADWKKSLAKQEVSQAIQPLDTVSKIHSLVIPLLPPRSPDQTCKLYYFQQNNAEEVFYCLRKLNHRAALIRAKTGDGKTYVMGQLIRWFYDEGYFNDCISPYPVMFITKPSIIDQTKEVLEEDFGLKTGVDVDVVGYPSLRAHLGEKFIENYTIVENGEVVVKWKWKKHIYPRLFLLDEIQETKNFESAQSLVAQAINNIPDPRVKVICASATPFSRVSGAKVFSVATRCPIDFGVHHNLPLTNELWNEFSNQIAQGDPKEYNKAAVRRLVHKLAPYIHGFKNVRREHKEHNHILYIDFRSDADYQFYFEAFNRYLTRKREIEGKSLPGETFLILVELRMFQIAAEFVKAYELAERAYRAVQSGKAAIIACNFKPTIAKAVNILNQDFNIPRSQISLIWGGDSAFSGNEESKYTKEEIHSILRQAITDPDSISSKVLKEITKQLEYSQSGLGNLSPDLELGIQSLVQRNVEKKRFQSGKSLYCFFTFGAGGAGLSLHHAKPELRPRETYTSPTWNEMQVIQAFGRGHRINSLSDTDQYVLAYKGTIEPEIVQRAAIKADCLEEVIKLGELPYNPVVEDFFKRTGSDDEVEEISQREFEEIENEEVITEQQQLI